LSKVFVLHIRSRPSFGSTYGTTEQAAEKVAFRITASL
jgi:hypothetical protein